MELCQNGPSLVALYLVNLKPTETKNYLYTLFGQYNVSNTNIKDLIANLYESTDFFHD